LSQPKNDTKCDYRKALGLRKGADFSLFREINFPGVIEIRRLEIGLPQPWQRRRPIGLV